MKPRGGTANGNWLTAEADAASGRRLRLLPRTARQPKGRHDSYTQAVDALGHEAVIELTVLAGYYAMISMILNAFEVPPPDGVAPPLAAGSAN